MCLYPKLIKNRKYIANKKNGGIIPAISDNRVLMVPVGCGKCMECKKQKTREWTVRLNEEIRNNKNGKFVTLTFSDESIKELDACIGNNIKIFLFLMLLFRYLCHIHLHYFLYTHLIPLYFHH